jgi:hypothetical protein
VKPLQWFGHVKRNGWNKDTEKHIRIEISRKETHGLTQKWFWPEIQQKMAVA